MSGNRWELRNTDFELFFGQLDIGSLVRFARGGGTQGWLADRTSIAQSEISRYESNDVVPMLRTLARIAVEGRCNLIVTFRRADGDERQTEFRGRDYERWRGDNMRMDAVRRSLERKRQTLPRPLKRKRRKRRRKPEPGGPADAADAAG